MTILIRCVDREIVVLGTYDNEDSAQDAMALDLAKSMGLDDIPNNWDDDTDYDRGDNFDIDWGYAWLNAKNSNYDWSIVTLENIK